MSVSSFSPPFFRTSHTCSRWLQRIAPQAVLPGAMASDFHANLNVAAGVVSGTLTACGSHASCRLGALPKRRGNAGSDSELPYHLNTFLEVRWDCALSHPHSLSLCNVSESPSTQPERAFPCPLSSLTLSPLSSPSSSSSSSSSLSAPLCLILFLCVLFYLFFFTPASSSWCFSSQSSSSSFVSALANPCWLKPLWRPAQLLGGEKLVVKQRTCPRTLHCVA